MELISVIVPVYNVEKYLEKCVRSIMEQTYPQLEIILVDDGATDESGTLCDTLQRLDHRIVVYHKENGGSSSARNYGLARAKGTYIGFVDGDDYILPKMYETLIQGIERYQLPIAQVGRMEIAEDGQVLPPICIPPEESCIVEANEMIRSLLLHEGDASFCTKLFDKRLFKKEGFPEGALNEDFKLLIQLLMKEQAMVQLPYIGYCVYYRSGSNTRMQSKSQFSRVYYDCVVNADWVTNLIIQHQMPLQEITMKFGFYQRCEYLLHIPISMMRRDNEQYIEIVSYVKKHRGAIIKSNYLSKKHKLYLLLFSTNARMVRSVHAKLRGIKENGV